ncbi:peptidoglycan-binding domain-containing protein [Brachybacterium sacelli]|uniref:peptidoglycan-binding domain-containing protein n=1 Tax=Brachybacterium sacelli TaxID=173364 RepID=UPI00360968A8
MFGSKTLQGREERPVLGRHHRRRRGRSQDLERARWQLLLVPQSTLRQGDRGAAVRTLQSQLNDSGASLTVDGIFGSRTAQAVRALQSAAGISVDNRRRGRRPGTPSTATSGSPRVAATGIPAAPRSTGRPSSTRPVRRSGCGTVGRGVPLHRVRLLRSGALRVTTRPAIDLPR